MFSSRTPVAARPRKQRKTMSATTSTEAAPQLERIITNWRRFSLGLWRVPRGDIADAYSASSLPKVTVFTHEGSLYTNGGCNFSKWLHAEVNGYALSPLLIGFMAIPALKHTGNRYLLNSSVVSLRLFYRAEARVATATVAADGQRRRALSRSCPRLPRRALR